MPARSGAIYYDGHRKQISAPAGRITAVPIGRKGGSARCGGKSRADRTDCRARARGFSPHEQAACREAGLRRPWKHRTNPFAGRCDGPRGCTPTCKRGVGNTA